MQDSDHYVVKAADGFGTVAVDQEHRDSALRFLTTWMEDPQFEDYVPQLRHMVTEGSWDALLDCFYQVIPFGTGGRRGEVGVGPNRINPWTIRSSAQGHSQYLLKRHGDTAKQRGLVLAYDVRQFLTSPLFCDDLPNPVRNLSCRDLALAAAEVYCANGITTYIFDDIRTTPELSFAVRHLGAVGGDVFSASHNPPEHNGKKVYDEFGGQLIPPHDEDLVAEVTEHVTTIRGMSLADATTQGLLREIGPDVDEAYLAAAGSVSLSTARSVKIAYSPLHGCGSTSVQRVLERRGFDVAMDPKTSTPSGAFEHVTFNIPNPEVIESFETPLAFAREIDADILLSSDPDADRLGLMVKHGHEWQFVNGNEIAAILCRYAVDKRRAAGNGGGVVIKTAVTTELVTEICERNGVTLVGDLLVGFKYVGSEMNRLADAGQMDDFVLGCEESHGYLAGGYARDKDAVTGAVWLGELAAELKEHGRSLVDYLNDIYSLYGYFANYLTEIRWPGAAGGAKIAAIQNAFRDRTPATFGRFVVAHVEDYQTHEPIVSTTDRVSKNILRFDLEPVDGTRSITVTLRPSGTEPKIKMYFQIGTHAFEPEQLAEVKRHVDETVLRELERAFMDDCYRTIDVAFPARGYLLFWQLPLPDKLRYFDVEDEIAALKGEADATTRAGALGRLLEFLGADPVEKVSRAFEARFGQPLLRYLGLPPGA